MSDGKKLPTPQELQREISDFIRNKYGDRIVVPPQTDAAGEHPGDKTAHSTGVENINFTIRPTELEAYLQEYVVGQEQAIEVLATKICTHFNRMKLETAAQGEEDLVGNIKSNVLMIGPTGVGKTYMLKLIAKKIGVPFVKGDATKFSETGYVGGDVEDLVRDLVKEAQGDIKFAEYGIVYLDEIDKIAASGNIIGPDVSRTGVQRGLLKLMEESEVDMKTPHDIAAQMEAAMEAQRTGKVTRKKINTKNILFVMSGAFSNLADIIRRRLNQQPIGFKYADLNKIKIDDTIQTLKMVRSEDLITYGFESEFVGRLPVVVALNDLDTPGLYSILKNPKSSVILGKKRDFKAYNITIDFEDEALRRIAELAFEEHTGARGLVSVVEKVLLKFEKTLPDTKIEKLKVTRQIVENPLNELQTTLDEHHLEQFQKEFFEINEINLIFTESAIDLLREKAHIQGENIDQLCTELLRDYGYGLRLLKCENFTISREIIENPKGILEELIKHTYENQNYEMKL